MYKSNFQIWLCSPYEHVTPSTVSWKERGLHLAALIFSRNYSALYRGWLSAISSTNWTQVWYDLISRHIPQSFEIPECFSLLRVLLFSISCSFAVSDCQQREKMEYEVENITQHTISHPHCWNKYDEVSTISFLGQGTLILSFPVYK